MIIRKVEEKDVEAVSATCMASFLRSVAGTLSEEGISTFSNIAASSAFLDRMKGDNLMLVAEKDGKIEGVIELKEGRHVAMLLTALNHAKVEAVTVSASLPYQSSVHAYEKYGFECKGETGKSAGLVYQAMVLKL